MLKFKPMFVFVSAVIVFLLTSTAFGQEQDTWEFNLAPLYLWAVNMDGDMTLMGNTTPIQADFNKIASKLEEIFTIHFEGMHNSGWGFLTDVSYLNLGDQQTTPESLTIDVDFTNLMVELAGVYRFSLDENNLDLIGGIRYYGLDTEINVVGNPPVDKDKDWVDAMLGARYTWTITDKWNFMARGDIGFGGSDLAWNLTGLFNYQPWKHVSLLFGYRYMDIDFEDGSGADLFRYDVSMHGPLLGLNFVW